MSSPIDTISASKRKIRYLTITVVILLAFVLIDFYISLSLYSDYENTLNKQSQHINQLYLELDTCNAKLDKYHITEKYITDMGADEDTAKRIIKASEAYNIDPK